MRVLITGGAGFVGSCLARLYREKYPSARITAFDNLRRRGGEQNLQIFRMHGIEFVHGDIRSRADLDSLDGAFDLFIEASAEPSVLAGIGASPMYAIETNLMGTVNALEFARARCSAMAFLSTSRVYSIPALLDIPLRESAARFEPEAGADGLPGFSGEGVSEAFPTSGFRSIYGSTKLASELLIQEYVHSYGLKAIVNRCGVIAGAGQFGKTDQGVFTYWVASHRFGKPLKYTGFGGKGLQVRDLLHPQDLFALLERQLPLIDAISGEAFNAGGGNAGSLSLAELTALCRDLTGREVPVSGVPETTAVDVPYHVSDCSRARARFGWVPARSPRDIVKDIHEWISGNETALRPLFGA